MSPECKDLIIKLLNPDPNKRLGSKGAKEIKHHAWFKGEKKINIVLILSKNNLKKKKLFIIR